MRLEQACMMMEFLMIINLVIKSLMMKLPPPIDSQTSMMDHNVSNDLLDCQMNSKNGDDN